MFGETVYIGIEIISRLFSLVFSFSPVLIQRHLNLLVKIILIRNCKS